MNAVQIINSLSLSPAVKDWLKQRGSPRILHVFDQACNLIDERGEVLSIVTQQIGNGPFNLVVEGRHCFSDDLRLESFVHRSATQLDLGDLTIHTADATLWNPRPDWERLHAERSRIADQLGKLSYAGHQLPIANLQFPASTFSAVLASADLRACLAAVRALAGLGSGLTPAGDDFIMGAMHAAWIIHPAEVASTLTQAMASTAAPLTTSLSAAWLRSAGRGEAGALWHAYFDALTSENRSEIREAMEQILSVGETSGADALAGFHDLFLSWKEGS